MEIVYTINTKVKIKNENGTSKRPVCSCGSWISHWKNFSYEDVEKCSVDGCDNKAEHGAHITRPNAQNETYKTASYIVPMCSSCNGQNGQTFTAKNNTTFVWANVSKTCGQN